MSKLLKVILNSSNGATHGHPHKETLEAIQAAIEEDRATHVIFNYPEEKLKERRARDQTKIADIRETLNEFGGYFPSAAFSLFSDEVVPFSATKLTFFCQNPKFSGLDFRPTVEVAE